MGKDHPGINSDIKALSARVQKLEEGQKDKTDKTDHDSLKSSIDTIKQDLKSVQDDADATWKPHEEALVGGKSEGVLGAAAAGAIAAGVTGAAIAWSPIKIEPKPILRFEPEIFRARDLTARYDNWRARRSGGRFVTESLAAEHRLTDMELKLTLHGNRLTRLEREGNSLGHRTDDLETGASGAAQSIQRLRDDVNRLTARIG